MNSSELEALLEKAATQFMLGENAEVVETLALMSRLAMPAAAVQLTGELHEVASRNATGADAWADDASRARMEEGLDQLRRVLSQAESSPKAVAAEPRPQTTSSALNQDPELVGDFILEAREHLQTVESGLLVLEKEPANPDTLNAVFRSFHTIKGLAGFLEFATIQALAHEVETILDLARTAQLLMSPNLIDLTLESSDYVGKEIDRIEAQLHGQDPGVALNPGLLLERVRRVIAGDYAANVEVSVAQVAEPAPPEQIPTAEEAAEPLPVAAVENPPKSQAEAVAAPVVVERNDDPARAKKAQATDTHAIRVDTAKLDYLLDMVGEMVIAESMVRLDPELSGTKNTRLQRNLNQLRRVTEEVQKVAMATRLIPVGTLFQRVNRLVRDTSRKAGKLAEVELVGEDTQLDKTIIEELTDPIMHMVRNSIDHGIEAPADRMKAGKPQSGRIQLKAYRQADHIQIEIVDDGRGLNKERILAKARERGLIGEAVHLTDSEIFQLIFEPGFSTAEKVTDISGRGVGMDVVKKQIQKLRGKIDIQSTPGLGTTFYLKLPLTLAIVEGLVVGVGRERYILPIFSVHEMFRPMEGQVSTVQSRGEMVMVRNQLLPLIRLYRSLGVRPKNEEVLQTLLIVAETEGKRFVLMVDEFIGKQEVVIKSLGASLKNTTGIAGGAILGDGRVGLILDLEAIYQERNTKAQDIKESLLEAC
jgi:two-component system, chemotaxis family, sensor kinase CheA